MWLRPRVFGDLESGVHPQQASVRPGTRVCPGRRACLSLCVCLGGDGGSESAQEA